MLNYTFTLFSNMLINKLICTQVSFFQCTFNSVVSRRLTCTLHKFKIKVIQSTLAFVTYFSGTFQEKAFHEEFDFLVSNPPYIKTADMDHLQPEVVE